MASLAMGPRQVKNPRDSNLNDSTAPQCLLLGIFDPKVFETNLNFRYQRVKNLKKYGHFCYANFKSYMCGCFIFFRFSTYLYLKLRFVSNNFWTKNPKTSHCAPMHFFCFCFCRPKVMKTCPQCERKAPHFREKRQ